MCLDAVLLQKLKELVGMMHVTDLTQGREPKLLANFAGNSRQEGCIPERFVVIETKE
jgi:hypothetical protein